MYWSVLSCTLLIESWTEFILVWVPFYAYLRLLFLLYLVLPQTQGARHLYETYLHPYLEENEVAIEDFIASAHDRLRTAGIAYLKRAIEMLKTRVLGLPPSEVREEETRASERPQGYTQALLARFSVPAARWASGVAPQDAGTQFYNLLAGAVGAATGAGVLSSAGSGGAGAAPFGARSADLSTSGTLIPGNIRGAQEKMSFIASQRERLAFVLSALDNEAKALEKNEDERKARQELRPGSISLDGGQSGSTGEASRPPSGQSGWSALSKSRSEVDFEKIDAESGAEDEDPSGLKRRTPGEASKGWSFLGWGTVGSGSTTTPAAESGQSSGVDRQ